MTPDGLLFQFRNAQQHCVDGARRVADQTISWQDTLSPDWDYAKSPDLDEDADLEGNLFAYTFLLAVNAYKEVTDEHEEALIDTYDRIKQPFLDANGLRAPGIR